MVQIVLCWMGFHDRLCPHWVDCKAAMGGGYYCLRRAGHDGDRSWEY